MSISSYLYVLCGFDGQANAVSNKVYRAQILNPLVTPVITDVDLEIRDGFDSNLTAGLWYYAISGVYDVLDLSNPGGESLAGPTITLQLPALNGTVLTINWPLLPGAVAYNVYRSPAPNMGASSVQLLAVTNETKFEDGGYPIMDPTHVPLIKNSIGNWAVMPNFNTARSKFGSVAVPNSKNNTAYTIYAFGGLGASLLLGNYEFLRVDHSASDSSARGDSNLH